METDFHDSLTLGLKRRNNVREARVSYIFTLKLGTTVFSSHQSVDNMTLISKTSNKQYPEGFRISLDKLSHGYGALFLCFGKNFAEF